MYGAALSYIDAQLRCAYFYIACGTSALWAHSHNVY